MTTSIVDVDIPLDVSIPAHWPMMTSPIDMFKNMKSQHCQKYESLMYFTTEYDLDKSFFSEIFTNFGLSIIIEPTDIVTKYSTAKKKKMFLTPNAGNAYLNSHVQIVEPSPNNTIDTDIINALWFDRPNHRIKFFTGVTYPIPSASPQQMPIPR